MQTIYKYHLEIVDTQLVLLPLGAEIISVQAQGDGIAMWAIVESNEHTEFRQFAIHGTGHPLKLTDRQFLGTVQFQGGVLVFHVFEVPLNPSIPLRQK